MPIKPPNAPDFACHTCGHLFRLPLWRRLFPLRNRRHPNPPRKCPKCGGTDIGILTY